MKTRSSVPARQLAGALTALSLGLSPVPALAGDIHAVVRDREGKGVADAVVVASPIDGTAGLASAPSAAAEQDQRNKEFVPHVLPVLVGTKVHFPNNDDIRHHVYSFSPAKSFELPLYSGTQAAPVLFDKPGVVVVGCNIHDWMVGYIYVSESPYFAKTTADGEAVLSGLPAGDYMVRIWHPRLEGKEQSTAKSLKIPATGQVETAGNIGLMPDFRTRRAPTPGRGGY